MLSRPHRLVPFSAAALLAAVAPIRAGLVAPAGSETINASDFVAPGGVLMAEGEVPFTLQYKLDGGTVGSIDAILIDSVLADPFTNKLTFIYNVLLNPPDGVDGAAAASRLAVGGFQSLKTDLSGTIGSEPTAVVARSADGATVELHNAVPGEGGSPLFVVRTNATQFDENGTANFGAADSFSSAARFTVSQDIATGQSDIAGAFRPIEIPMVPLPPAAYSATGVFLAIGLLNLANRARQLR